MASTSSARSTILDANSFRPDEGAGGASSEAVALARRRQQLLGSAYRLFYRDPVHLVRGQGSRLFDAQGNAYLDVYNNVASVGHAHPKVVAAIAHQAAALNTHTRYLHTAILDYAEQLLATLPDELGQVMFTCTGSEANDLAIRVARAATGRRGVIVTAEAYHGNTELVSAHSQALGAAQSLGPDVVQVPAPDSYRLPKPDAARKLRADVERAIGQLERSGAGLAALLVDSVFSSDGVYVDPVGVLRGAVGAVRRAGGIFVADEVQGGFARTGSEFWSFARHGVTPDVVTTGKPMGNGMPIAALMAKPEVLAAFADRLPYFNTFGGNPVCVAAAQAVLD
ncbi:MAG: aminotransferase class III-fold pyridoxal phosphate-dependent enzyme, partial [Bifidobacteriaceae bacterium]|nr:aminotransferase class III-fold pyridoxal phosphate-dependent enzyme [Bifidobacteriaceae bacterium]